VLRNIHAVSLGPGLILWYDLNNGRKMRFGMWNVRSLCRAGSLTATAAAAAAAREQQDIN